jgi:hypothetical protein
MIPFIEQTRKKPSLLLKFHEVICGLTLAILRYGLILRNFSNTEIRLVFIVLCVRAVLG